MAEVGLFGVAAGVAGFSLEVAAVVGLQDRSVSGIGSSCALPKSVHAGDDALPVWSVSPLFI